MERRDYCVREEYKHLESALLAIPDAFAGSGRIIKRGRNEIRVMEVEGISLNVKSFKRPNFVNRFVYAYLRPSKARRSFLYASKLLGLGIGTPDPVACIVYRGRGGVTRSFYISRQVPFDYEFRDLRSKRPAGMDELLRAFTRFTWEMHRNGIYFLDHSPGNTLIAREGDDFRFYLVDLNRMRFCRVSPRAGLRNFCRLNADEEMIRVMAGEYARLTGSDADAMTKRLSRWTKQHDDRVQRRRARRGIKKRARGGVTPSVS
ncbi:MAG: tyrosine protein kinase [Odoribacteraceae bacterium]|jgi:hypothetical protein|nr:tyrosine protein kinase [Odoribacteraceae bacterium]